MRCACVSCLCRHLRITRGPADPPRFCLLFFSLISQRRLRAHFPLISHLLFQPRAARPEERAHTPGLAGCSTHLPPTNSSRAVWKSNLLDSVLLPLRTRASGTFTRRGELLEKSKGSNLRGARVQGAHITVRGELRSHPVCSNHHN